jgi:uncharacterized protein (TIGR03790 family)
MATGERSWRPRFRIRAVQWMVACGILAAARSVCAAPEAARIMILPKPGIAADEIAVIVNDRDPLSVAIGEYYSQRRGIPAANIVHLEFTPERDVMDVDEFQEISSVLRSATPETVQAYALTWRRPFRVACMSITSAFALGYDPDYCAKGCVTTRPSPYYNVDSTAPFGDYGIRPAMSIAAQDIAQAQALIDRGVASDATMPGGTGYLVETADKARNVRAPRYDVIERWLGGTVAFERIKAPSIRDRSDVLFYFIGATKVGHLDSNRFLPGAIADHLTSTGGMLNGSAQMSIMRWLEAGATGSYGAVVEPCNFPQKFPDPWVVTKRYLQGETLIEAYWKSVQMPGQGVFIGEPLARPFGGYEVNRAGDAYTVHTRSLRPGRYVVMAADSVVGPFEVLTQADVQGFGMYEIRVPASERRVLALVAETAVTPSGIDLGDRLILLQDSGGHFALAEPVDIRAASRRAP